MPVIKLYTRKVCPLCVQAKEILLELKKDYDFQLVEMDISYSDRLTEMYGLMIPVVEIDGVEVQYGKVNKNVIKNYINKVFLS